MFSPDKKLGIDPWSGKLKEHYRHESFLQFEICNIGTTMAIVNTSFGA